MEFDQSDTYVRQIFRWKTGSSSPRVQLNSNNNEMGFSLDTPVDLIRRRLPIGQTDFNYVNNELTFTLPNFDQLYSNDFAYEQHLPLTSNGSAFEVITCSYSSPFPITISPCEQQMIWEDNNADFEPQAPGIWLENSPRSLITSICKNDLVSDIGSQQNLISRINFAQITPNETHFFNAEPDTSFSQSPIFPEQTDTVSQIYSQPFDRIDENLNLFTFDSFSESINSLLKIPKAASLFQVIPDQISSIDLQLLLKSKLMAKHNPFQFSLIEENEEILSSPLITPAWTIQGPCQCSQTAVNETVNVPNELSPQITKSDMSGTERAHDCINDLENTVCKKAYCLPLRGRRSGGKYMEKSESSRDVVEFDAENIFPCSSCVPAVAFARKTDYSRHLNTVHTSKKGYKCCGKFKRKDNLMKHLRAKHSISENKMRKECENRKVLEDSCFRNQEIFKRLF